MQLCLSGPLLILVVLVVTICLISKVSSNKHEDEFEVLDRQHYSGQVLRVVVAYLPPVFVISRNSSGHVTGYSGSAYEQLVWLALKLNFTLDISLAKENTHGVKINGTWNGLIGAIMRREADMAAAPFAISSQRSEAIDFCGFVVGSGSSILVRYPNKTLSYFGMLNTFSHQAWLGLFGMLVILFITSIFVVRCMEQINDQLMRIRLRFFGEMVMYALSSFTSQGFGLQSGYKRIGLLAVFWGFFAFVFVNIYTSTLTSFMSVTYQRPDINSFNDLANNPDYNVTTLKGTISEIDILAAKWGDLKVVGDRLRQCPSCSGTNTDTLVLQVLHENSYVTILPTISCRAMMQKYSFQRNLCKLAIAKEELNWKPMYFGLPKSSPYAQEIRKASLVWHESGLWDYWVNKMDGFPKQCDLKYNSKGYSIGMTEPNTRLKLQQFYFAFLFLFFGCLIASVQFIREKFHNHFEMEKEKKRKAMELVTTLEKIRFSEQQEALIAISFALFL